MPVPPEPFQVQIENGVLDDLRSRLERTRWSPEIGNADWSYGTNGSFLRSLVDYWLSGYDWRAQESVINHFPHYKVELEPGIPIHFVHVRGTGPSPLPIILSHGWPGPSGIGTLSSSRSATPDASARTQPTRST